MKVYKLYLRYITKNWTGCEWVTLFIYLVQWFLEAIGNPRQTIGQEHSSSVVGRKEPKNIYSKALKYFLLLFIFLLEVLLY